MVVSNSDQEGKGVSTPATTTNEKEEPSAAATNGGGEEEGPGVDEGGSKSKDEEVSSPDSSNEKMDTSSKPTASSSSVSSSNGGAILSPGLGGLGRHKGLTEQLSRAPSSLSRVSNNMAAISASKVTASTGLSSSLTPSEQLQQQQLLQVSKNKIYVVVNYSAN